MKSRRENVFSWNQLDKKIDDDIMKLGIKMSAKTQAVADHDSLFRELPSG